MTQLYLPLSKLSTVHELLACQTASERLTSLETFVQSTVKFGPALLGRNCCEVVTIISQLLWDLVTKANNIIFEPFLNKTESEWESVLISSYQNVET